MNDRKHLFLILLSSGMTLSLFYAYMSFIFTCLSQKSISLIFTIIILLLAILITYIHKGRGWIKIAVISLHVFGFFLISLWLYHGYYHINSSFWNISWVNRFLKIERNFTGWTTLLAIFLSTLILWVSGTRLLIKPINQTTISHRFDLGLALLFFLMLVRLIIIVKGGTLPTGKSSIKYSLTFIILGLFTLGFIRTNNLSKKSNITYIKNTGIIISFTTITLLIGGSFSFFFSSGLQTVANASYSFLGNVIRLIGQIMIATLRFFWGGHQIRVEPIGNNKPSIPHINGEIRIPGHLASNIIKDLTILLPFAMAGFIIYQLLKWLFSKTAKENNKKGILQNLILLIFAIKNLFLILWITIFNHSNKINAVNKYYEYLLRWGRISGLGHNAFETPREYAARLAYRFPRIKSEITNIINLHDETFYGNIPPDNHKMAHIKLALRRIRNPRLWADRAKSLFFQNHHE